MIIRVSSRNVQGIALGENSVGRGSFQAAQSALIVAAPVDSVSPPARRIRNPVAGRVMEPRWVADGDQYRSEPTVQCHRIRSGANNRVQPTHCWWRTIRRGREGAEGRRNSRARAHDGRWNDDRLAGPSYRWGADDPARTRGVRTIRAALGPNSRRGAIPTRRPTPSASTGSQSWCVLKMVFGWHRGGKSLRPIVEPS